MKYKLLKDTPTIKAGTIFEEVISDFYASKQLTRITPIGAKICPQFTIQDIDNFDEWFEKITDSIHWKPKNGEKIWYLDENGNTNFTYFNENDPYHLNRLEFGNTYRTSGECELARERRLAEVRLRQTSGFKPNFKNGNGGWVVMYDYFERVLAIECYSFCNSGEPVRYETEEEALKSIKENERDWKIYFGIKEEE
nr:MAG TPA: hypothetical protein [Caudoviricetes sp.]